MAPESPCVKSTADQCGVAFGPGNRETPEAGGHLPRGGSIARIEYVHYGYGVAVLDQNADLVEGRRVIFEGALKA